MVEFYDLCRICLRDSHLYSNIFEEILMDGYLVHEIINNLYEVDTCVKGGLPEFVCIECLAMLKKFVFFKRKARKGRSALLLLKQILGNKEIIETSEFSPRAVEGINAVDISDVWSTTQLAVEEESSENEILEPQTSKYSLRAVERTFPVALEISDGFIVTEIAVKEEPLEFQDEVESHSEAVKGISSEAADISEDSISIEVDVKQEPGLDMIDYIYSTEKMIKEESISCEEITEAPKETSFKVCRRILRPGSHKDYRLSKSNSEENELDESSSEENAAESFMNEHPVHHESTLSESVTRESLSRERETRQYAHSQSNPRELVKEEVASEDSDAVERVSVENEPEWGKRRTEWSVVEEEKGQSKEKPCEADNEQERMYSCNICRKVFVSLKNITRHLKYTHSENRPFLCDVCGKTFKKGWNLKSHSMVHSDAQAFSCEVCGKDFRLKKHMEVHQLMHSGRKLYECTHCDKGFNRKGDLEKHQPFHDGKKVWECGSCPESFGHWKDVVEHRQVHLRKKELTCDECSKKFWRKWELRDHMMTHILPHRCDICERTFSYAAFLKNHMRSHTDERPYSCTVCKMRFKGKHGLTQHMRRHARTRP